MRWLLLLLLLALPARAEQVVAGLSQNRIAITANFDGSEILIFGAVKREAPPPGAAAMGVVITLEGPKEPVTVRRKDRWAIIWVNQEALEVDRAPSFYAVATSGPLDDVLSDVEDLRHSITIRRAIRSVGAPMEIADPTNFTEALIRIRERADLYQIKPGTVEISEETLFNTSIALPANLVEGNYRARFFLTRDGAVVSQAETLIYVQKVGLERFLYTLAHEQPLVYGLMSLAIAIAAGWGASAVFRYLQG
ncbi:hypothetical protein DXV76_03330 [Rhodobacteraceae bacterium CCMM004]|nr:hypothetical protein DXV76_03330 [Rhodobacteraceae bacterium CCMM004]